MGRLANDGFNDANGTALTAHSASWLQVNSAGAFQIQSNALQPNLAATDFAARYNVPTPNDQYARGVIISLDTGGDNEIGVAVRCATTAVVSYYAFYYGQVTGASWLEAFKIISGAYTSFGKQTPSSLSLGDIIQLEIFGTNIIAKRNGAIDRTLAVGSGVYTDSSLTAGQTGVAGFSNLTSKLDNWEGGDLILGRKTYKPFPYKTGGPIGMGVGR